MKVLLVVDLQEEFKDKDGQFEKIVRFVNETNEYDKIIATRCFNSKESSFVKYNVWDDCLDKDKISLLNFKFDCQITKVGYGLEDYSILDKKDEYTIVGFNSDACILKVALDLFDKNYNFRVLSKYCYHSEGKEFNDSGLAILKLLIGDALE